MSSPDLREIFKVKLDAFAKTTPPTFRAAALDFFNTLGYASERTARTVTVSEFRETFDGKKELDHPSAIVSDWRSAHLLFQLADENISPDTPLMFSDHQVERARHNSYIFLAVELTGSEYSRGKLAAITRRLNRVFPQPVMVLFKIGADHDAKITLAVINRRPSKLDADRDVLGKVTLIRDINTAAPHRGHLDILNSLALPVLRETAAITNFDTLHAAWEKIFNVELLNQSFYRALSNWYFWALPQVEFPADLEQNDEKRRATALIRLLTRLIFCWFIKEKNLIPEKLFDRDDLKNKILKNFDPADNDASTYYHAILQNLFFATLNQRMGQDADGQPYRHFITNQSFQGKNRQHGLTNFYRYPELFSGADGDALRHFADIPFLNGGLFECLDYPDPAKAGDMVRVDGFTAKKDRRPVVPNHLFFAEETTVNLDAIYGDRKHRAEKVSGLIHILNRYKFTVTENTPIDQEIALDPELLGKVFENLLASYNEETKTTARKQTGSFYTPRPIVEYMVDESLKAHLVQTLTVSGMKESDAKSGLELLFTYTEKAHPFADSQVDMLLNAIHTCKILDPACGSGAFPMGILQKLVYIIHKLDPDNAKWKQIQIDAAAHIPDTSAREAAIAAIERDFADNDPDYGRKLYLIQNCLYGVDIQPVAIQISKLRFFISLVCDQRASHDRQTNHGIRPLPNLETKFVAANTLVGLNKPQEQFLPNQEISRKETELDNLRKDYFTVTTRQKKLAIQEQDKTLRTQIADLLKRDGWDFGTATQVATWNPYDHNAVAEWFDPEWMFGVKNGFDVVIGNPPYVFARNSKAKGISSADKTYFYAKYDLSEYQINFYPLFIERGTKLLRQNGFLSFITPNNWLTLNTNKKLRRFVLEKSNITIVNFYKRAFESADVDSAIVIFNNAPSETAEEKIRLAEWNEEYSLIGKVEKQRFLSKDDCVINIEAVKGGEVFGLLEKIENNSILLSTMAKVKCGLGAYGHGDGIPPQTKEMIKNRVYHSTRRQGEDWFKYIEGEDVMRYECGWRHHEYLKYGKHLREPRNDWNLFSTPRILVRQIPSPLPYCINACYVEKTFLNDRNSMNIVYITVSPKCLLALLNSRVISWWFAHKFGKLQRGIFPQFKINELAQFPIPKTFAPHEQRITELADAIMNSKCSTPNADISNMESEIDRLVYQLYGLSPQEIAIIEGANN